jgi:hypothetical protein
VRRAIALRLAGLKPDSISWSADLREALRDLSHDPSPGVRAPALNGLNNFRDAGLKTLYRALLADSSYYVEAAAMNCLLTVDSTGAADVVGARLRIPSREDVLALNALAWTAKYRYRQFLSAVDSLAQPGPALRLRLEALRTLAALGAPRERFAALASGALDEPVPEARILGVLAARYLGGPDAVALLRARLGRETDDDVRAAIGRLLGLKP